MHIALSSDDADPNFAPEPFADFYRNGLYHGMIAQVGRSLQLLRARMRSLSADDQEFANRVLEKERDLRLRFKPMRDERITAMRIRHHGDYHLGQVLYTGKDFYIIDFEGEPARPLSERRIKRSPLRDVAGMLRSFQYAAYAVLFGKVAGVVPRHEDAPALTAWAQFWAQWVGSAFLRGYLDCAGSAPFIPKTEGELRILLDAYLLEKALYEVSYELNNRPGWVGIPLRSMIHLLEADGSA
jgi:maltose alpha-D-glucosyltransferase/alpha-amylase